MMFACKRPKINKKDAGVGPFKKNKKVYNPHPILANLSFGAHPPLP